MELIINHTKKLFSQQSLTLEALMQIEVPHKTKGIAVALNERVIPRTAWSDTLLCDQDTILIITAAQGG